MDKLAEQGMFFPNTFTNVPICVPARGSLMTGKHPLSHKAVSNDLPLPISETGIAQVFKVMDMHGLYRKMASRRGAEG